MNKTFSALLLATVFLVVAVMALPVEASDPIGGCPDGFSLHPAMDHDDHHGDHLRVGTDTDSNGDGWICARHVAQDGTIHVHIDNYAQKP